MSVKDIEEYEFDDSGELELDNPEAREIAEEVAEDVGVDMDDIIIPEHKLDILWEDLSEEEYREHMRKTFAMVQKDN